MKFLSCLIVAGLMATATPAKACFLEKLFSSRPSTSTASSCSQCQTRTASQPVRSTAGGCCGQIADSRALPPGVGQIPQQTQLVQSAPVQAATATTRQMVQLVANGQVTATLEGSSEAIRAYLEINSLLPANNIAPASVPQQPPARLEEVRTGLRTVPGPIVSTASASCPGGQCPNRAVVTTPTPVRFSLR